MQARKKEGKKKHFYKHTVTLNSTKLNMCCVLSSKKLFYLFIHPTINKQIKSETRQLCRLCRISSHHAEMITTCHVALSLSYVTGLISPAYPWHSNREPSPWNFLCMRAKGQGEKMRPLPRRPSGSQPLPPTTGPPHDESPPISFPVTFESFWGYFTTSTWALIHLLLLLSPNHFTQGYTAMCMFYVWFKWAVFYKFHHLVLGQRPGEWGTLTPKLSCTCPVICWALKGSNVRYIIYMWWVTCSCICRF